MALNFSEWQDSLINPTYQVEGKDPKCPDGHKWDKKLQTCVPDTKNGENPGEKECPSPMLGYDIIGATGIDGDGVAIAVEEGMAYQETSKEKKARENQELSHKKDDDRMRYGKSGRPPEETLRPGEVKKWNAVEKRWVSNKEGK